MRKPPRFGVHQAGGYQQERPGEAKGRQRYQRRAARGPACANVLPGARKTLRPVKPMGDPEGTIGPFGRPSRLG